MSAALLNFGLLLTICFCLATWVEPRWREYSKQAGSPASISAKLLGESRRLLAGQALIAADKYFHLGYYPSVFELAEKEEDQHFQGMVTQTNAANPAKEKTQNREPLDWLERFSRHFHPSVHVHADEKGEAAQREILPWLRIAAELEPENPQVYVLAGFYLRTRFNRIDDAESFLRDGLRANPGSPEILLELSKLYLDNRNDPGQSLNLAELAWRRWLEQAQKIEEPDIFLKQQIVTQLVQAETKLGHWRQAIRWLEELKKHSPNPESVAQRIEELRREHIHDL